MAPKSQSFDVILVGSGVSGSFMAMDLAQAGLKCLMLEAGESFTRDTYPDNERDANSRLYWAGGVEFNSQATLGFLRAKVVGGGSVVNQALLDRFDDDALSSWKAQSGVESFSSSQMLPWYERAEKEICLQSIPEAHWNRNARIFQEGFEKNGFQYAPLRRAQKDCRYQDGNDCICCLAGCRLDSKQSMVITTLPKALKAGLQLVPRFEVTRVSEEDGGVRVSGVGPNGSATYTARRLVLAAGSLGNVKLLLSSGFGETLPALGHQFFSHPQYMTFARYRDPVNSHRGPFQSLKSADPGFRKAGFKLENVYAPPVAIAMLLPARGRAHHEMMRQIRHFACIEVAVRDTEPGRVFLDKHGKLTIEKRMNAEDRRRRDAGLAAVTRIFESTGAEAILPGQMPFSLHLMGGCGIGTDPSGSVVDPEFRLHGHRNIYIADSSLFPNAPGINPSLTVMAMALMGAESLRKEEERGLKAS